MKALYNWLVERAIGKFNDSTRVGFYMVGTVLFSIGWLGFVLGSIGNDTVLAIDALLILLVPVVYSVVWLAWPLLDRFVTWCYSYVTDGAYAPPHVLSLFFIDAGIVEKMKCSPTPDYPSGVGSVLCFLTGVAVLFMSLLTVLPLRITFWIGLFCFVVYTVLWIARALYRTKNMVGRYP